MRKVIKAIIRAYHLTSLPSPLSGIKGTIKAPKMGNKIDKLNHGKSAWIGSGNSIVPIFKLALKANSKTRNKSPLFEFINYEIIRTL